MLQCSLSLSALQLRGRGAQIRQASQQLPLRRYTLQFDLVHCGLVVTTNLAPRTGSVLGFKVFRILPS